MNHNYRMSNSFCDFKERKEQVGIVKRKIPSGCQSFFKKFYQTPFSISGFVNQSNIKEDIDDLLNIKIFQDLQFDPFYKYWLIDMSQICKEFCSFLGEDRLSFWLGSERGCKRYHVDMVPFRLLVTYDGQGTELLPNKAANRNAFFEGKSNEKILKNRTKLIYINKWDIAIFRGGKNGILHRTPDSVSNGNYSILMRLDDSSFLKDIIKINNIQ